MFKLISPYSSARAGLWMCMLLGACTTDANGGDKSTSVLAAPTAGSASLLPAPSGRAGTAALSPVAAASGANATAGTIALIVGGSGGAGAGGMHAAVGGGGAGAQVPVGGASGMGVAGMGGAGGMSAAAMECLLHGDVDPRDDQLTSDPLVVTVGVTKDLLVPQLVLDWMSENQFAEAHDGWHLVRKWDQSCRKSNATAATCAAAQTLANEGLSRAPIQQGAPGDGYAFMLMHRHMIRMLKMSFPKHEALFSAFDHVPRMQSDPQNPTGWKNISWTADNIQGFDILENIEQHLDQFATEDDLGQYIENTYKWTAQNPTAPVLAPGSGLHGALHSQWAVNGSPADLIMQSVDVRNFTFWKLHGWIDNIWERYRKAKGISEDDPKYQQALFDQCMEMYSLQPRNRKGTQPTAGSGAAGGAGGSSVAAESGEFARSVRPIFDTTCAGCHSAIGPNAGMTLGGAGVTSAAVRAGLVGVKSTNNQYNLIEPNHPELSWVYLKASGDVAAVSCTTTCNRETMPPSGASLTAAQLTSLKQWINDGATDK